LAVGKAHLSARVLEPARARSITIIRSGSIDGGTEEVKSQALRHNKPKNIYLWLGEVYSASHKEPVITTCFAPQAIAANRPADRIILRE